MSIQSPYLKPSVVTANENCAVTELSPNRGIKLINILRGGLLDTPRKLKVWLGFQTLWCRSGAKRDPFVVVTTH